MEYSQSAKFLQLLKEIVPRVTRAAVIRNPASIGESGNLGAIQGAGPMLGVEVRPIDSRDADTMQRAIEAFAAAPNGGLIVPPSVMAIIHRDLIIALAARNRLPAVYGSRLFIAGGGLISYGIDTLDVWRRAPSYIDRILKGEKPADLPVQAPVKYETVLNMKTAKALGLDVPASVLVRADEVIE
jgi:putative ABC transport system substrate-binding protein